MLGFAFKLTFCDRVFSTSPLHYGISQNLCFYTREHANTARVETLPAKSKPSMHTRESWRVIFLNTPPPPTHTLCPKKKIILSGFWCLASTNTYKPFWQNFPRVQSTDHSLSDSVDSWPTLDRTFLKWQKPPYNTFCVNRLLTNRLSREQNK